VTGFIVETIDQAVDPVAKASTLVAPKSDGASISDFARSGP
jgi:hypothetical protein